MVALTCAPVHVSESVPSIPLSVWWFLCVWLCVCAAVCLSDTTPPQVVKQYNTIRYIKSSASLQPSVNEQRFSQTVFVLCAQPKGKIFSATVCILFVYGVFFFFSPLRALIQFKKILHRRNKLFDHDVYDQHLSK